MSLPHIVNVYGLMLAPNVCNQELREVMRFSDFSVAHVITHAGDSSQLHEHHIMKEMYYIASGSGVLTVGEQAFSVDSGAYVSIPPNTPHRLHNSSNKDIEYLVLATPPFQTKDVDVILDTGEERIPQPFKPKWRAFEALDGATVYEVDSAEERRAQGFGVAIGFLPPLRAATRHYHNISHEIYYVASGKGKLHLGDKLFDVTAGSVIYVPVPVVHGLENISECEDLRVLCISSPPFQDGDFIKA